MYKPAWKQEYIISGDYSLLRLFAESEDTLDEFLHRIIVLLWIDNRSVLARTGILSSLLLLVLRNCALSLLLVLLSATLLLHALLAHRSHHCHILSRLLLCTH